ncbi:MAG: hypothetical protein LAO06_16660 [Acidobacteriia bacterium]|nr:hypothetical protein [Terriglobia bacterium]
MKQSEADALLAMAKLFVGTARVSLVPGVDESHELVSADEKEQFMLDIWRGTIRIAKLKKQTRARKITVLARLDVDGSPHTNPDGTTIGGTHLHLYKEGFEDRWAFPVPSSFSNLTNINQVFVDFCAYCNIQRPPATQVALI